jgi:hypothetical protein
MGMHVGLRFLCPGLRCFVRSSCLVSNPGHALDARNMGVTARNSFARRSAREGISVHTPRTAGIRLEAGKRFPVRFLLGHTSAPVSRLSFGWLDGRRRERRASHPVLPKQ